MADRSPLREGEEAERPLPPTSLKANSAYVLVSCVTLGLGQLLAWLGNGWTDPFTSPLSILQFTCFVSFAIQVAAWVPSTLAQNERYYDLTGSLTYLTCVSYSLAAGYTASVVDRGLAVSPHAFTASAMVYVWALRLGWFLFWRARRYGDARFVDIKRTPLRFLMVWAIQGLWVFLTALPTFIVNSSQSPRGFVASDAVGGALYLIGFGIEIVADRQKTVFKNDPANKNKFISTGLWAYSRHPNYLGEWVLQLGILVFCAASFQGSQWVAVVTPVFLAVLLRFISGVPLLEKKADERFGDDVEYQRYKRETSICLLLPKLPESLAERGRVLGVLV